MSFIKPLAQRRFVMLAAVAGAGALALFALAPERPRADVAAGSPAAIPVKVHTLSAQSTRIWAAFSGRTAAVEAVAIRPEVSGRIVEVRFRDGAMVKAGEVLFVIDPQPFEAALARAEANLASAIARAKFSRADVERARPLMRGQFLTQRDFDQRDNTSQVAEADVKSAQAAVRQARLDLDHAYVKAPIAGRASRAELTTGNVLQAGPGAPLLTTIVAQGNLYVDFDVDEQTYVSLMRNARNHPEGEKSLRVEVTTPGAQDHPASGRIESFDNRIDTSTGAIRARALLPNAGGERIPGMFVSVRLAGEAEQNVVLAPERAIGTDQSKKFVFVVGPDDKVAYREVGLGPKAEDGRRVVRAGLKSGDRLIVDGLQHLRPNMVVRTQEASLEDPRPRAN